MSPAGNNLMTELARIVGDRYASAGRVDRSIYNRDLWPRASSSSGTDMEF